MKTLPQHKTWLLAACICSAFSFNAQTAGTTSLNPIELTDSVVHLTEQSPEGNVMWYKLTPADSTVFIQMILTTQSRDHSLSRTDVIVTDDGDGVIDAYGIDVDSIGALPFYFSHFNVGGHIYVKQSFDGTCESCTASAPLFNLSVYQGRTSLCLPGFSPCNLVKNPSFEDGPSTSTVFPVCHWKMPATCTNTDVGSSDWPVSGHTGFYGAGIFLYANNSAGSWPVNSSYREYIQSQLISALIPGKTYQFSFWLGRYNPWSWAQDNLYCKDISVFFSNVYPCQNFVNNINLASYTGQSIDMLNSITTHTVYQKYVVTFTANAAYDKITIGNFKDNPSSTIQLFPGYTSIPSYPSSYVTIDDLSLMTPTLTLSSPFALPCPTTTFQFNPTVCELDNTTYTYYWFPSTGLSNPNILNPVVNVNSPIVYTLTQTGTNSFGTIVHTATVSVIYPNGLSLNASATNPVICQNYVQNTTTISAGNTFAAYHWEPGNMTGSTHAVSPTVTTIYTVTASWGSCVFTATTAVSVSSACCDGFSIPKFNGANVPATVAYNTLLYFNNDITVLPGANLALTSGEYLFAPNVKITVAPNAILTIRDAHLYACGAAMWKGIVVQNGGKVICTTTTKDNLVEDAITAIDVSNQSSNNLSSILNITNTTFNKNYIDVSINNYTATTATYPFIFNKCVFTCRNLPFSPSGWPKTGTTNNATTSSADLRYATGSTTGLVSPFLGQGFAVVNLKSPYAGQPSQTAILLNNVGQTGSNNIAYGITIGDASQTTNYNLFDAHNSFINATNSNVNSFNNTFQNTKVVAGAPGSAVKSINNYGNAMILNSKLDLVSPTNPSTTFNRFYDCHTGIEARNQSTLNVKYARITSGQSVLNTLSTSNQGYYGMYIESNRFNNYQVHNSQFSNLNIGIYCASTANFLTSSTYGQSWGTFSITANLFCPASATNALSGNGFVNTGIVVENILMSRAGTGPTFYAFTPNNGLRIQYNNFYKVWNGVSVSNFFTNGFAKLIASNVVNLVQQGSGTSPQRGISSYNNNQCSMRTNTVSGFSINTGFPTSGIYTSLNSNSDVQCNNVTTLPRGFEFAGSNPVFAWRGNMMTNNGRGMQGTNWGTSAGSGGIGNQGASNSPSDNFWQGTWNGSTNLQTWTDANTNAANSKIYARNGTGYVLNQSWNNGANLSFSYWVSTNRPSASSSGYVNCNIPVLMEGREWHDIADEEFEDETSEINQFILFINLDMDSLLLANDDTLQDFYEGHEPEGMGQLSDIENDLAAGLYEEADGLIEAFSPETNIQSNFKQFFRLYSAYRRSNSLSVPDSTDLFILANQCPFTDGPAVYKARALFNLIYGLVVDYNDEDCAEEGYSGRAANLDGDQENSTNTLLAANESRNIIKKTKTDYKISPNPTVDAIYIRSKKETEQIRVIISDMSGRQLLDKFCSINAYQSDLRLGLPNGVYTITLMNSKNERITKKLVISK